MRRTARILALAALAVSIAPTAAQADDDDELVALNKKLQATIAALPNGINVTPTSDDEAVQRIQKVLAEVRPQLKDFQDDERLPVVMGNVKTLEGDLVSLQAGHKAVVLFSEIRAGHDKNQIAAQTKLKALDEAIAAFQKVASQRHRFVADDLVKKVVLLRKNNEIIAKEIKDLAEAQAREAAEAKRAALAEQARKSLDHLYVLVKAGDKIPDADLNDLKTLAEGIEAAAPGSAVFYKHEHARISRVALWQKADPEAQQAIADSLGATLVAKGASPAKAFTVTFPATEDWCYVVVGRFAKTGGTEKIDGFGWAPKAGRNSVQVFTLAEAERGAGFEQGLCALKAGPVTATAKLSWLGGANSMRFAVLGWERAKFPAELALRLAIEPTDHCDLDHWKSLWTRPLPGTLVWRGAEPFLLTDEEGRGLDLNGNPVPLRVEQLTSKAHPAPKFTTAFKFQGCTRNGEPAWTADSKALKACDDGLVKKFAMQKGELVKAKAGAEAIAKWSADLEAELTKKCGKQIEKVSKPFGEAFGQLSAELAGKPFSDPIDRAGALQARLGIKAQPLP
ncbi:MAG TPA: hypothetical protein VGK67_07575 [Myxococcales bacterium]|jgi:hypothetical protein